MLGVMCTLLLLMFYLNFCIFSFSEHFHIFVGDLSPDIESHQLREAFQPFGTISWVLSFDRIATSIIQDIHPEFPDPQLAGSIPDEVYVVSSSVNYDYN